MTEAIVKTGVGTFYIHRLPLGKPVEVKTAIRDKHLTLLVTGKGKIYSGGIISARVHSESSAISFRAVNLLASLGVITQAQADEHTRRVEANAAAQEAKYELIYLRKTLDKYGVKVEAGELAKVERVANSGGQE